MNLQYEFHHMGIPTTEIKEGERYSSKFKMYTTDSISEQFRIQFHRFEEDSPLHEILKTMPHAAYKVNSIDLAIKGEEVILEPYYPFAGYKVAAIVKKGVPIEFIETSLSEEEIWEPSSHKNSLIYPELANSIDSE